MKIFNFAALMAALIAAHANGVVAAGGLDSIIPSQGASSATAAAPPPPIRSSEKSGVDATVLESPPTPHVTLMGDLGHLGDLYRKLTSSKTFAAMESCTNSKILEQLFHALKQAALYIKPHGTAGGASSRPTPAPVSALPPLSSRPGPGGAPGIVAADDTHALASPGEESEEDADDNDGDSDPDTHPLPSPKGGDDEKQAPSSPTKKQRMGPKD